MGNRVGNAVGEVRGFNKLWLASLPRLFAPGLLLLLTVISTPKKARSALLEKQSCPKATGPNTHLFCHAFFSSNKEVCFASKEAEESVHQLKGDKDRSWKDAILGALQLHRSELS